MTQQEGVPRFTLADRLRKARETTGLDQAQFGAEIGVTRQTVSNAETGAVHPLRVTMLAWAARTGVPLIWLEHGEDAPDPVEGNGDVLPGGWHHPSACAHAPNAVRSSASA